LVFEDLHWAADRLLDLVEGLMQPRAGTRLLVLSVAGPELLERGPLWRGRRRSWHQLALVPPLRRDVATTLPRLLGRRPRGQPRPGWIPRRANRSDARVSGRQRPDPGWFRSAGVGLHPHPHPGGRLSDAATSPARTGSRDLCPLPGGLRT